MLMVLMVGISVQAQSSDDPFFVSAPETVVDTESGQLLGALWNGTYTFLGVPYAQAERWMMPEPVEPWEGLRGAVTYGESCPIEPMTEVANDELFNPHRYFPENENCQFLNIWTPEINDDVQRPVMVWLHGGGWRNGSAIEQEAYDGANLSSKGDVVVVSLNHRIGVLGYFDLSAYGEEFRYSGNVGVADMVAALEWVQANISEFGGDPNNVTIFGQSGGGRKVISLLTVPAADGLFHKAIIQSSGYGFYNQELAQQVSALTLENLGLGPDQMAELQAVPYLDLLAAADGARRELGAPNWEPVLDGDYWPMTEFTDFTEQARDIPVMIGSVLTERDTVIRNDPVALMEDNPANWSREVATERLQARFGENGEAIGDAFVAAYPRKEYAHAAFVDDSTRFNVLTLASMLDDRQGAPVFAYQFAFFSPVMDGIGMAWHCSEIPYAFNNVEVAITATGGGAAAQAMGDVVSQAWINFARYGDPNHDGMPEWPAYTRDNGATMIFDSVSEVGYNHDAELLALLRP